MTGEDSCTCQQKRDWKQRELETIGARDDPPHAPPYRDHATLWLDESGDPAVYGMHVYPGNVEMVTPPIPQSASRTVATSSSSTARSLAIAVRPAVRPRRNERVPASGRS